MKTTIDRTTITVDQKALIAWLDVQAFPGNETIIKPRTHFVESAYTDEDDGYTTITFQVMAS